MQLEGRRWQRKEKEKGAIGRVRLGYSNGGERRMKRGFKQAWVISINTIVLFYTGCIQDRGDYPLSSTCQTTSDNGNEAGNSGGERRDYRICLSDICCRLAWPCFRKERVLLDSGWWID